MTERSDEAWDERYSESICRGDRSTYEIGDAGIEQHSSRAAGEHADGGDPAPTCRAIGQTQVGER
jgi:hypothetical protein